MYFWEQGNMLIKCLKHVMCYSNNLCAICRLKRNSNIKPAQFIVPEILLGGI